MPGCSNYLKLSQNIYKVTMSTEQNKSEDKEIQQVPESKIFRESDAGDGTRREDQYLEGLQLLFCALSIGLCLFLVALDQTIVSTILTTVGNHFNAFNNVGWLASGFLLTMAVFIQPFGRVSLIVGRKYTMIVAIVLFEAGSLMCGLAPNMNVLIGGRVLSGIGGAGIQSMTFVILSEILPISRRPLGILVMTFFYAVASVLGPVIGGAFVSHVSWRWAFYINLPIGCVAAIVFFFTFKPPSPVGSMLEKLKTYDYFGSFLMIAGTVVFLLALTFGGSDYKWGSAPVILCFVLGFLTLVAFSVWNFKFSKSPLIPIEIVREPTIIAAFLCGSGALSYFIAILLYLAIYFQVVCGKSALSSGLHLLPVIIALIVSSMIAGVLMRKTGQVKLFTVCGAVLGPVAGGLLSLLEVDSSQSSIIGLLILSGVSIGLLMQASLLSAQMAAPKTPGATILTTTLFNFFRSLLSAIAGDLADVVYTSSVQSKYLKAYLHLTNQTIIDELSNYSAEELISNNTFVQQLSPEAARFVKNQIMASIKNVFYMAIGFIAIATISSLFVTNTKLPRSEDAKNKVSDKDAASIESLSETLSEPVKEMK